MTGWTHCRPSGRSKAARCPSPVLSRFASKERPFVATGTRPSSVIHERRLLGNFDAPCAGSHYQSAASKAKRSKVALVARCCVQPRARAYIERARAPPVVRPRQRGDIGELPNFSPGRLEDVGEQRGDLSQFHRVWKPHVIDLRMVEARRGSPRQPCLEAADRDSHRVSLSEYRRHIRR